MPEIAEIVKRHMRKEGPLLPILHDVQAEFGFISEDVMHYIADQLNLSRADVFGVVSFYHDFNTSSPSKKTIKLCRAEACQARGVDDLVSEKNHSTDKVNIEPVYCLGLCSVGPVAMVEDKLYARLDRDKFIQLVESF